MSRKKKHKVAVQAPSAFANARGAFVVEAERRAERAQAIVRNIRTYDPDQEYKEANGIGTDGPTFFDFNGQLDPWGRKIADIDAQLFEVSGDGKTYRLQRYRGRERVLEAIKRADEFWKREDAPEVAAPWNLRESSSPEAKLSELAEKLTEAAIRLMKETHCTLKEAQERLREDYFDSASSSFGSFSQDYVTAPSPAATYGSGYNPVSEYIPIMGGPWNKQLYLQQYLEMHAKAFEAYNHNPVAKDLIVMTTYFTLGRGLDHQCTNMDVDEVVREFVERTNFYERLENMMNDLWWAGENMTEFYDDAPKKGYTDFRAVDPSTVWQVVHDPEDIRKVYYYHQQFQTPFQMYVEDAKIAATKYIIRHIPADSVLHTKINASEWETRGRSDLFPVLGWLKRLKDLMNARVIKGQLEAAFVWDITIKTGDADVQSIGLQLPDPYSPGATFIHNNSLDLKPQSSQMHGSDAQADINSLTTMIANGMTTPKEFVGESSRGARSTVLASTEPGTKRYEARQMLIERYCHKVMDRVIQNAADAKLIDLDDVLVDARSVKRLSDADQTLPNREDAKEQMEKAQADAEAKNEQQRQDQLELQKTAIQAQGAQPQQTSLVNVNRSANGKAKESLNITADDGKKPKLNDKQKRRIDAIKKSGRYSRELIEFSFPSIAQEDRSQKLKDLALAEAMEWLPKSITATMAARELNITTYQFEEAWRMIVAESLAGMSIAHVFGQDNKHVPETVVAQDVQEMTTAEQAPNQQAFTNVPVPPAVNGFKQQPQKPGAPGGAGDQPNTGDTKVNNKLAPKQPNPTAGSHGYSDAAKSPFTAEGRAKAKESADAVKRAIYVGLLREAIKPMVTHETALARLILETPDAVHEYESAVREAATSD